MSSSDRRIGNSASMEKKHNLPEGWVRKESRKHKGKFYFFNVNTGESTWFPPSKVQKKPAEIRKPGASRLSEGVGSNQSRKTRSSAVCNNVQSPESSRRAQSSFVQDKHGQQKNLPVASSKSTIPSGKATLSASARKRLQMAAEATASARKLPLMATLSTASGRKLPLKGTPSTATQKAVPSTASARKPPLKATTSSASSRKLPLNSNPSPSTSSQRLPVKRKLQEPENTMKSKVTLQCSNKEVFSGKQQLESHFKNIGEQFEKAKMKNQKKKRETGVTTKGGKKSGTDSGVVPQNNNNNNGGKGKKHASGHQAQAAGKPSQAGDTRTNKQTEIGSTSGVAAPKRPVSLSNIFSDDQRDRNLDESYVPMDVSMEDVGADEVHSHLHHIRGNIGNSTTEQQDTAIKVHLAETSKSPSLPVNKDGLYIVLDTNVLISHLTFLEELRDQSIKGFGKPILIVPWVVLQELDGLKTNGSTRGESRSITQVAKQAIVAGHFIHNCVKNQHPRLQCQTPQSALASVRIPVECNDDKVLQCCLQYQQMGQGMTVILFSNDTNLCTKTLVSGVTAFTKQDLLSGLNKLSASKQSQTNNCTGGDTDSSTPKTMEKPVKVQPVKGCGQTSKSDTTGNKVAAVKPTKQDEHDLADNILCELKKVLIEALSAALEREMKNAFDDAWIHIVLKKPPWSFQDLIKCYDKHWIAVFGMFLNKDDHICFNKIKEHFTSRQGYGMRLEDESYLLRCLRLEEVGHVIFNSHELIQHLHIHDKENGILKQSISTLASLLEKCNNNKSNHASANQPSTSSSTTPKQQTIPNSTPLPKKQSSASVPTPNVLPQCETTRTISSVVPSTSGESSQRTIVQTQNDETHTGGARERRLSLYSDDDVDMEMVTEEVVPSALSGSDATASILQVFQSVGETLFDKSASLLQAVEISTPPSRDRYTIERSLLFLCTLLLPIVTAMTKILQCGPGDDSDSCYHGICDALDVFTRECDISPSGSGLQPSMFHQFMSIEANKQILATGLEQFATKLQELHGYIKNIDSDLYMKCQETLIVLSHMLC